MNTSAITNMRSQIVTASIKIKLSNMTFNADPPRKWKRKNFDEEKLSGLNVRERSEIETDRDLIKPIEQLVCDVHEEIHNTNGTELGNLSCVQKRMVSMMARVALSNDRLTKQLIGLTWVIIILTLIICVLTVFILKNP
jgi:hypothetical protein